MSKCTNFQLFPPFLTWDKITSGERVSSAVCETAVEKCKPSQFRSNCLKRLLAGGEIVKTGNKEKSACNCVTQHEKQQFAAAARGSSCSVGGDFSKRRSLQEVSLLQ